MYMQVRTAQDSILRALPRPMPTLSDPPHPVPLSFARPMGGRPSISPAKLHSPHQPLTARVRHTHTHTHTRTGWLL
ncbi:hypothetical protein LX32DRAFT_315782 [Colletotrichum zoysiae]|uniref:Uncharacterized protein n=1 Tax=Colletotrichum zoysiae TaxID=1216348 RepID=A0AAD9LTC5_9PEZI|nr:hypothetical protein LX32DRAFT_315782 [Colletotrichum zoysiae]